MRSAARGDTAGRTLNLNVDFHTLVLDGVYDACSGVPLDGPDVPRDPAAWGQVSGSPRMVVGQGL